MYSPAKGRSPAAPVLANNGNHRDDDGDDGCGCGCDGGSGGGGDSNNGPPRLKNTRVLAHSRPDDTVSRCCGTKIGAAGPHGVFRAARLTSRNPPHTTIDPNGGRTDVRTDGQAGKQGGITGEAAGAGKTEGVRGGQRPRGEGNGPSRGGRGERPDESGAAAAKGTRDGCGEGGCPENDRATERTNERANERASEQANERTNERRTTNDERTT